MKVFLHTGAGKTGTSAIQVALAALRGGLSDAGVHYPGSFRGFDGRADRGKTSSGNATALGPWLNPNQRKPEYDKAAVAAWLRTCIADAAGRDLLFSSEAMQFPRPEGAADLCDLFVAAGYQPTVIFYVRHALDQAVAGYLQHLKRGFRSMPNRERTDIDSFLRTFRCNYLASLSPFATILPAEQIVVKLYDDEASQLVPRFLRLVTGRDLQAPDAAKVVNRSPTEAERKVFEVLAQQPEGDRLCRLVADLMLDRKAASGPIRVSEAAYQAFFNRNKEIVEEVNARYLAGNGRLLMKSERIVIGDSVPPPAEDVYAVFAECFALLEKDMQAKLDSQRASGSPKRAGPPRAPAAP